MSAVPGRGAHTVLVIGEALVDVVHRADGRVDEVPGGSPANVAITLGRLGRAPRLLTRLADDARGRAVRTWLEDSGVSVDAVPARRTATATAHLDADGSASYVFDIGWDLAGARPAPSAGIVHTGSIASLLTPGADEVGRLVARARAESLVTYDPNIRPALLGEPEGVRRRVEALVAEADLVKASDEDLRWLYPGEHLVAVAERWLASGPAAVVVTTGAGGSFAVSRAGVASAPAQRVTVVDTVGAGDTFMGALIDTLLGSGYTDAAARTDLRAIQTAQLQAMLAVAARAAAITVSRPGADPPRREELDSVLSPMS